MCMPDKSTCRAYEKRLPCGMGDSTPAPETRPHALAVTMADGLAVLGPPAILVPAPLNQPPARVRAWFDDAAEAIIPDDDGTLATARLAAEAYARRATAANTRRAYRAGVRA